MTFRSEFVASPETFMQNNVVTPQFWDATQPPYPPGAPGESRPIVITIHPWPNKQCSKRGGGAYHISRNVEGPP